MTEWNQTHSRREALRAFVYLTLSDGLMIFLAVLMAPIVLLPIVFDLPSSLIQLFSIADTAIILVFVLEYFLKLILAPDPLAHFLNRWHLLDLLIITLPLLELLPGTALWFLRSSPTLRLLRVARVIAVGGRTVERRMEGPMEPQGPVQISTMQIRGVVSDLVHVQELSPADLEMYLRSPSETWIHIAGVSAIDFDPLSRALGLPKVFLESKLKKASYPRIDLVGNTWVIFVQEPRRQEAVRGGRRSATVTQSDIIALLYGATLVTITRRADALFETLRRNAASRPPEERTIPLLVLYTLLEHINDAYRQILGSIEGELIQLENVPDREMPPFFLETTFQLRRETSRLVTSLFHLREVVSTIVSRIGEPEGAARSRTGTFDAVLGDTEYLHETAENVREGIVSLIELHINTVSYEMNRAMRMIAVLSALVLIPTLVGQLLGMNILDAPWNVYLWQVATVTIIAMLAVGWIFYKLGWLR